MRSIVIPAHNEEQSVAVLLRALAPLRHDTEVVLVCNGCSDRTADVARAAAGWVHVLDLPRPSKPAALDAGDAAATGFPRLYLDADVVIDAVAVDRVFAAVEAGLPSAAATPRYDTHGASWVVRSHQRFWERLPANNRGLAGTNAMAVSAEGRARFVDWPVLIGDDYFLDGLFADVEKPRVPGAFVTRPTPQGFRDCVSRKARVHQGNLDVRTEGLRARHTGGGGGGAAVVVREDPRMLLDLPAHVVVTVATRLLSSWRRRRGTSQQWFQDRSRTKA